MTSVPYPRFELPGPTSRGAHKVLALSLVGLAVFLAWQALTLNFYVRSDTRPPAWDQAIHMEIALDYRTALQAGRWGDVWSLAPKPGMPPFPPLYHLAVMRAYDDQDPARAALWVNWFYMAVLCLSLFAIAWEFRPDHTALAAVVVFACSPAVQALLLTQLIDLAVVACAAAAYWALLRSEDFTRWGASVAFGAIFAVGMMHKWSFFSYMFPAYWVGAKALTRPAARLKALAALAAAVAGCGPWYANHLPLLVPRLFQATSDFAVPVWKGGAFFSYLWDTADGLGPAFWILGWIALLVPQYRRNWEKGWIVPAWVVTSYVFWAIVPNRQMRFLLPGLPGLAVAICGAWPPELLWILAAAQVFLGANYSRGWISAFSIPSPFGSVSFLSSNPPAREDWKIADILREAQRRYSGKNPVANLTLVANATYFNGPNFTWTAKRLKLPNVRIRGVNKRLCEFSEFVVLKSADLGPPGVIEGLPEAASTILYKGGWFSKSYEEAARWPLPDRSFAILYQRRRLSGPPFKERAIAFQFYTSGPFSAAGLKIELGKWDPARAAYPLVKVSAAEAELRGLKLTRLAAEFEDLVIVPAGEGLGPAAWDEVRFVNLGKLRIVSASIDGADVKAFLEERVKGLAVESLDLDKTVRIRAQTHHLSLSAEAAAEVLASPPALRLSALQARLGATPLPVGWLGGLARLTVPFAPNPETPFAIELPGLTIAGGRLTVP